MTSSRKSSTGQTSHHQLKLIYPNNTQSQFIDNFPTDITVKNFSNGGKILIGRNNQDYELDLVLMDSRISRKQAEISYDTAQRHFKLTNLTKSEISVDNVKIYENDIAVLRQDTVIRFERLATGKENGEKMNFIQFRVVVRLKSESVNTMSLYSLEVLSEKEYSKPSSESEHISSKTRKSVDEGQGQGQGHGNDSRRSSNTNIKREKRPSEGLIPTGVGVPEEEN